MNGDLIRVKLRKGQVSPLIRATKVRLELIKPQVLCFNNYFYQERVFAQSQTRNFGNTSLMQHRFIILNKTEWIPEFLSAKEKLQCFTYYKMFEEMIGIL